MGTTWRNPYWASLTGPDADTLRSIFIDLSKWLQHPTFNNGIEIGSGEQATVDPSTSVITDPTLITIDGTGIQSSNFVSGASGWQIKFDGTAEFNNVALRGTLSGIDGASILPNGTFEVDTTHWVAQTGTTLSRDTTVPHSGAGCLRMDGDGTTSALEAVSDLNPVTPGQAYRVRAYGRPTQPNRRVGTFVVWLDGSGTTIRNDFATEYLGTVGAYTAVSGSYVAPSNAANARIAVYIATLTGNVLAGEVGEFDDVSFAPASTATMGLLETASSGERIEVQSGDGNFLRFYSGDPLEEANGQLSIEMNGDTSGGRWAELYLKAPEFRPAGGDSQAWIFMKTEPSSAAAPSRIDVFARTINLGDSAANGASKVVMPRAHCRVLQTTPQTLTTGVATALAFQTEQSDGQNMHAANATKIVVPTDGIYHVEGTVWYTAAAGGQRRGAYLGINGTITTDNQQTTNAGFSAAQAAAVHVSDVYELAAGDYIELYALQDTGANLNTVVVAGRGPYLAVSRVMG